MHSLRRTPTLRRADAKAKKIGVPLSTWPAGKATLFGMPDNGFCHSNDISAILLLSVFFFFFFFRVADRLSNDDVGLYWLLHFEFPRGCYSESQSYIIRTLHRIAASHQKPTGACNKARKSSLAEVQYYPLEVQYYHMPNNLLLRLKLVTRRSPCVLASHTLIRVTSRRPVYGPGIHWLGGIRSADSILLISNSIAQNSLSEAGTATAAHKIVI